MTYPAGASQLAVRVFASAVAVATIAFFGQAAEAAGPGAGVPASKADVVAGRDLADLLAGLEGYPAEEMTRTLGNLNKRFLVVDKITDGRQSEDQQGTLRWCVESAHDAPPNQLTWIVFDPRVFPDAGGPEIELRKNLSLGSNTIIDGRGARVAISSSLDVHLVKIDCAKNVVLENLVLHKVAPFVRDKYEKGRKFPVSPRPGLSAQRAAKGIDRDGVAIRGTSDNIWIDHCTLFLCGDECIGASHLGAGETKITVSWCRFSDQYYVALIGHTTDDKREDESIRLTFHHNWIQRIARRSPRVNRATAHVYNNYYDGWVDWAMAANASSRVLVEANIFERKASQTTTAINIGTSNHLDGFVRARGNLLAGGAKLDTNQPDKVEEPGYLRSVDRADDELKEIIRQKSGRLSP